ncbi:gas vesicle protein GvpU [Gracilibacillus salitolerans]|uniref:Gas vesicle protein GvpU n=1 Tax=Gracilibacillus salitolerans TaxID=2663022 RepID=A0A5Q2TSB7_9BACI|nr:gas vesicle accessory protein GvpU [Gracilibacillus salitolerans]QGH37111.1 gas vesicle protein GvpU [Gracilibacillus salitolerans]
MSTDSILGFFVQATNKHDFNLEITLNVNGALVSGTTISAQEYFEELSEAFEDGNEVSKKISEQLVQASEGAETSTNESVSFIHLKNTKVYCGDSKSTPSKGNIIWRGKLSEIDGFFLGKIAESKSSSSTSNSK